MVSLMSRPAEGLRRRRCASYRRLRHEPGRCDVREFFPFDTASVCSCTSGRGLYPDRLAGTCAADIGPLLGTRRGAGASHWPGGYRKVAVVSDPGPTLSRTTACRDLGQRPTLHSAGLAAEYSIRTKASLSRHGRERAE